MRLRRQGIITAAFVLCASTLVACPPARTQAEGRHTIVLLGDSVTAVTRWWPASLRPLWRSGVDVINEAWGCQALLNPGCEGSGGLSAVQRLVAHHPDDYDAVVVGTGYNDVSESSIAEAMALIVREARTHGARVVWMTYHARDNVRLKSRRFNPALRAAAARYPDVTVVDWSSYATPHGSWFRGGGMHLNAIGGMHLGRFLAARLHELWQTPAD